MLNAIYKYSRLSKILLKKVLNLFWIKKMALFYLIYQKLTLFYRNKIIKKICLSYIILTLLK